MKKFLLLTFAALIGLSGCKKDDNDDTVVPDNKPDTTQKQVKPTTSMLCIHNNKVSTQAYQVQYVVADNIGVKKGKSYEITIKLKASKDAKLSFLIGDWQNTISLSIDATTEMKEHKLAFEPSADDGHVLFQTGDFVGDIYIESVTITHKGSGKTIPLTEQQKHDTLVWAMDHWIEGMMTATNGFVKSWDVVNEAISGGGSIEGFYTLQHSSNPNDDEVVVQSGNFFWQDYMGDIDYVRTAVASARKHFKGDPDELKLFINDYNLESDWDDNKKLKSLIYWVDKWEADGVTKIDGLGTQMHISYYDDEGTQKSKEEHIVKMFELMAATGKLVRVSELDMGYMRGNTQLKTSQVTAAELQKMADYYEFILNKYFEIVPPEQQYGFCQWCMTDAPDNTSWRAGEPVGIWKAGYVRKAAYKGFAQGLAEQKLSDDLADLKPLKSYIKRSNHPIFKISGALDVSEFSSNATLKTIVKENFDEVVAGNAMKYQSCVNGGGDMDFSRVKTFITNAKNAGVTIFGHTLAWHSQQQPGYLLGLMKDIEIEVPDKEKVDVVNYSISYDKITEYKMWRSDNDANNNVDYSISIVKR